MKLLAWVASSFLLCAFPASADTFYVAPPPAGNDANPGTVASPWATLEHADSQVSPGDTVLVRGGNHAGAQLTTSGTAVQPILWRAFPGEEPSIVSDNASTPDGINIEGASHLVIEGFRVDGRTRAGIRAVLCENVTLRNNRADGNGRWGILTGFCDDLTIEGNVTTNSVIEHGIYVSNSGDRPVIRGNLIHGNNANGIHMNGDASLGGDGVISQAIVENNVIFDNGEAGGSGINCDGVQFSRIANNLIYDTHASGISLYRIDGGAPSINNRVYNNTVVVASDGRWGLNIQNASTGNEVRNNVFYSAHSFRGAMSVSADSLTGFVSDHNAVENRFTTDDGNSVLTLAEWRTATGQDANSLAGEPLDWFEDFPGDDYRPASASALLDAGNPVAQVPTDILGTPRPQGATYDIGAYEGAAGTMIFTDGFEAGTTTAWDAAVP
ncbi:MAG: right-handed parallel beta-helix repeat-containing protein [Acidobacteriota bacterium]